ncbi:DNA mismatch repair endonuclease MutL [Alteromonas sp. ASW11-19]|uniref:DNA mismatch repair protein MutL n=1 Tax=Alteromonas salexigens TaxID=2982530 RepID=A0ABT2VMS3_9ALTE|nr:DNA mismatch repair endonuclease MutL [Alteromonas salexigens]MCU7554617.1 DNA mismatch repair endonuclease MutL [Alteromonas salexigens]
MPIQLLPPRLANQIAAGEVVERPASVVKELVENSLDAGASKIEIDIEKGGHKRIRLRDNGCGIDKQELELALSRHATSKISTLDDLEQILSLGFRGEALASISSVSRLTLTSKPASQAQAWQAHCEGREMAVKLNPVAHPDGTTIDVADLFYNTPARRKFLRAEKTEFQHIDDVIRRIALSHPEVTFILRHNDKVMRRFLAVDKTDFAARIAAVAGQKFVRNAVYCHSEYHGITLEAWLGNEHVLRSSTDCQFSFVNGRGMRDKLILHAIRQAYESAWGTVEQPAFVVYLTVPPSDVDVNVHPAKHEVRFQQSRLVHDFISKTVADALQPQSDYASAGAAESPVTHDYIRPLSSIPDAPAASRTPRMSPPQHGAGHSAGPRGGMSSPSRQVSDRQSQTNYQQLMTPTGDTLQTPSSSRSALTISPSSRLYARDQQVILLQVHDLARPWLTETLSGASTSQPLLMPVSITASQVTDTTLRALAEVNLAVDRVAGKIRLQQVPAGTRHWPWLAWFSALVDAEVASRADIIAALAKVVSEQDDAVMTAVWQWFDAQAVADQWEWITEFGKVRTAETVCAFMEQDNG